MNNKEQLVTNYFDKNHAYIFEIDKKKYSFNSYVRDDTFGPLAEFDSVRNNKLLLIEKIEKAYNTRKKGKKVLKYLSLLYFLAHPNIVILKEIYVPDKTAYENVYLIYQNEGTDLERLINSNFDYFKDEKLIPWIMYQILKGLHYIHSLGIIHRNLKPSNIRLDPECRVKITGFGHAINHNNNNYPIIDYISKKQSLSYQAPEVLLKNEYYLEKSDLWSVGCIMIEIYNKKIPFFNRFKCTKFRKKNQLLGIYKKLNIFSDDEIYKLSYDKNTIFSAHLTKKTNLKNIFQNSISKSTIDLMEKLLCLNPENRISIIEASKHPYFDVIDEKYKKIDDFPLIKRKFVFASEKEIEEMEKKHLSDDFQINYYKYNIKLMNIKISRNDNSKGKKYINMSTQESTFKKDI